MRIGLFAHRLAEPASTGIGRYVHELVSALGEVAAATEEVVLASTPEAQTAAWVPATVEERVVRWPRQPVHTAWCLGTGPHVERSLGPVDVMHLLSPFPPAPSNAPQVLTIHDVMPLEHPNWYPRSERWIFRRAVSLAARRASRIVVPSAYVAERLTALLSVDPATVVVVPHGVSRGYASKGSDDPSATCDRLGVEPGRFAVCVGSVSTRKNLVPVIRAMAQARAINLPLLIVGPNGYGVQTTEAELARIDAGVTVKRTGYLPDEEVAALVKSAAVLVHPALEEGFGLVPLEAMAAGTPVIASRAASIPEVVGDAAVLVEEPSEARAWAAALVDATRSPERMQALARAGRERAATFTWQRVARTMLDLYEHVART